MRKSLLLLLLLPAGTAFAQLDSYTATITASRSLNPIPDQVVLNITLTTDLYQGPDDVLSALQGLNITIANLTAINNQTVDLLTPSGVQVQYEVAWMFALTVPLATVNTQLASLATLGNRIYTQNGWTLNYEIGSFQASSSTAPQCVVADLVADARAQAVVYANVAGFNVGRVMALSDGSGLSGTQALSFSAGYNSNTSGVILPGGNFSTTVINPITFNPINIYGAGSGDCMIVVKFSLTGGV